MKKWIIIAALVALLIAGIFIVEKITAPDVGGSGSGFEPEATTTEETYCEEDLALMELTWEEYQAMTVQEQEDFKNSFTELQVYIDWYWMAKDEYDAKQDVIVIGPGQNIDIGDFVNGSN